MTFSPFERDVSDVATRESVLKKNSTVKFNYIKWTRLKMERVCFKSGPLQLTEHLFYLAKRNVSSAAVLRLRLSQTRKPRYQQSGFRASHSTDTGDGELSPTVITPIWSEVKLLCEGITSRFERSNNRPAASEASKKLPPRLLHNLHALNINYK